MDEKKISDLTLYTLKLIDQTITPKEFDELNSIISSNAQAARYYNQLMMTVCNFQEISKEVVLQESVTDCALQKEFWKSLAEYEKTAPEIKISKEEREQKLVQKAIYPPREKRKMSKWEIGSLIIAAAAVIVMVLFVRFAPPKGGIEVATLTDSVNAKWADTNISIQRGTRLYNDKTPLLLREGLAELTFDNNTRVTIEGPAEFQILDDDMIKLNYGQVYSQVPPEAYGFQICTQRAKIIDLGTEFGIKEEIDGDTEIHVLKGQVNLISNILSKRININLLAGSARELDAATGELKEISCKDNLFTRQINSNANFIWKGQDTIPLTNLLAGTLFDKVSGGFEINPITGESVIHENYVSGLERQGTAEYQQMDSPFVDGTFVPQGQQPQVISGTNITWQSPKTSGFLFYNLSDRKTLYDPRTKSCYPISLTPDDLEKRCFLFHPNMGVTLDLDKIRQEMPTLHIRRFQSDCGISYVMKEVLKNAYPDGNVPDEEVPGMDFTILLDGKVRKTLSGINLDSGVCKIDVEIHPEDRFLTLVATDGNQSMKCDWFILADPVLEISPKE